MLFVPVIRHPSLASSMRAFDRFFADTAATRQASTPASAGACNTGSAGAEDKAYELSFDVPGVTREQISIGIEGNVIRIETLPEAARQYKAAYEVSQDIDVSKSEARLENGVLTLKLGKAAPQSKSVKLTVN
jgi:HSP20 family protein